MSNIKLYLIKYEIPALNRLGIATVAASSPKQAQDYLQAQGKYNGYKYDMNYPIIVHTTDTWTAAAIISEIDNPVGEKGDRGPQGLKGEKGEKGDPGDSMTWEKMDPEDKMTFKEDAVADVESEIKTKYYPNMSVGMADNLVGRGDVQDAHINFRPSAGEANITDHAARIERIKGNSVVWNQLCDYTVLSTTTKNGITCVNNGDGSFSVYTDEGGATASTNFTVSRLACGKANHWLYISGAPVGSSNTTYFLQDSYSGANVYNEGKLFNKRTTDISAIVIRVIAGVVITEPVTFFPKCTDLTQMFGADNEPTTIEKYLQRKPMNIEDEFADNAGKLVDMKVDSLISTSDNAYNSEIGSARVMGGVPYTITVDNRNDITPEEVYFSETLPVTTFEENIIYPNADGTYTFPSIGYAKASFAGTEVGKEDTICICLKHSYDKPHPAHQQDVKDLSFIGEVFPEGMRSAGSAYDEIRYNPTKKKWEAVKRIGETKVGNLSWGYIGVAASYPYGFIYTTLPQRKYGANNVLNERYPLRRGFDKNHSIFGNDSDKTIYIVDSDYTDATIFKNEMADAIIYYELAEPIVVELDYPTEETNMDYRVWDFGTEEAIVPNNVPSAPFRADINYEPNAVDDLRWAVAEIRNLKAQIAEMQSVQVSETSLI